ncbi:MAG: DUF5060 domain-containing protein [Saprospiraceae bacterium]|nr:DUF5060 domain-containing protein [Saprospiraceae bacterium]
MKRIKTIYSTLSFLAFISMAFAAPTISATDVLTPSVGKYQKWELKATITNTSYTNPYDFAQARLSCTFTSPSGMTKTVDGFWKKGYYVVTLSNGTIGPNPTEDGWYVRFSPTEVGNWSYSLSFIDAGGTSTAVTGNFTCAASTEKGFIRRQNGKNYLKFDNGTPYIPVGQNLCWYNNNGIGDLKTWMDPMANNNANFLRYWLCYWGTELEWTTVSGLYPYAGLKQYEQSRAFQLDWLVDYATQKGLYIDLCLQNHGQIQAPNVAGNYTPQWQSNPYSIAFGGPCNSPSDFWTDGAAKLTYKNKLRYIVARWGFSSNILTWEFFNELDLTENYATNAPFAASWITEMATYLKSIDPNSHLTSNSYVSTANGATELSNALMDITQVHYYDGLNLANPPTNANYETILATQAQTMTSAYNKPFLTGEFGLFIDDQNGNTANFDPDGVMMHNVMWSSLLNGSAGAGFTWWWDSYTHPLSNNTYKVFGQVSNFANNQMNVVSKNYKTITPTFTGIGSLSNAIISPQFAGFHPPTYAATPAPANNFTVNNDGTLTPSANNLSNILFNNYHIAAKNPPTFNVNYPAAGEFRVTVAARGSSSTSTLVVIVDGTTVFQRTNPDVGTYSVNVPSGMHTIKVDNTGNEWIQISNFTLTNYVQNGVPINGNVLRDGNHLVGWALNRDYNWKYLREQGNNPPPSISNANMNFTGLVSNQPYVVQFFNTDNASLISTVNVTANAAGALSIPMPTLSWDVAFRIEAGAPVPIELLTFTGKATPKSTVLTEWITATEADVSHFELQRSADGFSFSGIGKIKAAGQSTKKQAYQFEDIKPLEGINYYRLKTHDVDGKTSFSNTIAVTFSNATHFEDPSVLNFVSYPNPTTEDLTVRIEMKQKENMVITLTDLNGRIVLTQTKSLTEGIHQWTLPTQSLPQGVYILTLNSANHSGIVRRIVKQ